MADFDAKRAQHTDRAYQTPDIARQRLRTLDALHLTAGERVLDVGCGTGLLAHNMASLVGAEGQVTGFDISDDMLALARDRCAHLPQVHLKRCSAEKIEAADESFDAVVCTQVLLYVADVPGAIAEMHRVLKPGGRIAALETDWRGVVLNSFDDALTRTILSAWDKAVESPNLPVRLSPLLHAQGFAAVRVEAIPIVNTSRAAGNFSVGMTERFARHAQKQGAISEAEMTAWLDDLRAKAAEGSYFFCVNRFLFTAVRV